MVEIRKKVWFGASSILTALGDGEQTLSSIRSYKSGLAFSPRFGMICGQISGFESLQGYSRLESLIISQIENVLKQSSLSLSDNSVKLILSTTKGNVDMLESKTDNLPSAAFLPETANRIGEYFNSANKPVLISNACISGLSALILGRRMIVSGGCEHAIVVGCDVLSEFITSGFASFKSISPNICRPYDKERDGLNLGEACACVLLTSSEKYASQPSIRMDGGSVSNDANHISGPSRTGDGLHSAIKKSMEEAGISPSEVGMVNAHGTATVFNDEMESKALALSELSDIPLNSFKGYIGHSLGAAGVVETVLCLYEMRENTVFGSYGFSESGVPCPVNVSDRHRRLDNKVCIKTASGFGGCNAAIVMVSDELEFKSVNVLMPDNHVVTSEFSLSETSVPFAEQIREEYHKLNSSNIKFFKMSDLCKLAYIGAENIVPGLTERYRAEDIAVILSNYSSSLDTDIEHQKILEKNLPEGTSPAVFVYTLPSVAAGEICIRHKITGDNTFFVSEDNSFAEYYARLLLSMNYAKAVICGWCEKLGEKRKLELKIIENKQ